MNIEDIEEKIWAIVKINFKDNKKLDLRGGFCGTGFFIDPKRFITAAHIFNNEIFSPLKGYDRGKIFLVSQKGDQIEITNLEKLNISREKDILSINFEQNYPFFERKLNSVRDEEVYNLGYPENSSNSLLEIFQINPLKILLKKTSKTTR